ncbi:Beta-hexosaminidase subunit alpha [Halotydeus destructor]|nr:Beta-hexosaminidase subunit alpha [Halotydeus destructor]
MIVKLIAVLICITVTSAHQLHPKYKVFELFATQAPPGSTWPKPQQEVSSGELWSIDPNNFQFVTKETKLDQCDVLKQAIERYKVLTFIGDCSQVHRKPGFFNDNNHIETGPRKNGQQQLTNLTIQVRGVCQTWPTVDMDEMYTLRIATEDFPGQAYLFANSVWGAIRGLETFAQLVHSTGNGNEFAVNSTFILDYPRFSHRGFMVDTSRHFIPVGSLLRNLEAMEYNKMNVFHWHIVDDPSFPYVSQKFPELSLKGAYFPTHIYSPQDVAHVIEFARVRGIRVMIEFDSPGHTLSWGNSIKNLLTPCYDTKTKMADGTFGPVDPSQDSVYTFLQQFFAEVASTFPEQYIHLGGDEVPFDCWQSNPNIAKFMQSKGLKTYTDLESYYLQRVVDIVGGLNKSYIVWQEVFDNGVKLQPDTVVHVWKDGWLQELADVTEAGYSALLSSPWYLNYIHYGPDWMDMYTSDPQGFNGTVEQLNKVLGGEACLWTEFVDSSNLISRSWPRGSAVAERLWSSKDLKDWKAASPRLELHNCRMQARGVSVEPLNGPSSCKCDYATF